MKVFEIDFLIDEPFTLESGEILPSLELRCTIYGQLNADKSNANLVFHALTGSSKIGDWWKGLIGDGKTLDTSKNAFVCVNYIGSCYGSTSARAMKNRRRRQKDLPVITTRDIVRSNTVLFEYLGIKKFKSVIGGSVGGMLALQLISDFPEIADECISIGATPLSSMALALNHIQRQALALGDLGIARQIAMLSYKSQESFDVRFGRRPNRNGENPAKKHEHRFDIGGYLDYQAKIFAERFEIESYKIITKAMDLFDLTNEEIERIKAKVTLVGISSDWLFPAKDVEKLAARFNGNGVKTDYLEIVSDDGHDAFLSDVQETSAVLKEVFEKRQRPRLVLCAA